MCGITSFFAKESVPNKDFFYNLLVHAKKRGNDGFGVIVVNKKNQKKYEYFSNDVSDSVIKNVSNVISLVMDIGDVLLCNFRAAPETEVLVSKKNIQSTLQPLVFQNDYIYLVHNGAISQEIVERFDKYKSHLKSKTKTRIDSRSIAISYIVNNRDIKKTVESLSGGWSFILLDTYKWRLISSCSSNPLTHGYIKGVGYIIHSLIDVYSDLMKSLGRRVTECGSVLWEDFYWHEREGFRFFEVDLDSGVESAGKYQHYFIHPTWDCTERIGKNKYLVLASGGLDSTATACILKSKGYDVELIHFNYGHRGSKAEEIAVKNIADYLNVDLKVFDITDLYKTIDSFSMLTNRKVRVVTGMKPKTTNAWTCGRNMIFLAIAASYAESLVMKHNYNKVYLCGGYAQLTESGVYPDNTEKFIHSMSQAWKYGTLAGAQDRIKHINVCANITKYEQVLILKHLGYENILSYTVSCDRPKVRNGVVLQCSCNTKYGQMPACGSGLLSWWALKKANVQDTRKYYYINDENYKPYIVDYIKTKSKVQEKNIQNILERLIFD